MQFYESAAQNLIDEILNRNRVNLPISSILSASSIISKEQRFNFTTFVSIKSVSRPGVATQISTPEKYSRLKFVKFKIVSAKQTSFHS